MSINRRHLLLGSFASVFAAPAIAAPAQGLDAAQFGVRANADEDQSARLQRAIDKAAEAHAPLWLAPGRYRTGGLTLRAGSQLTGIAGQTLIALTRGPSLLSAQGTDAIALNGLTLDGGNVVLADDGGLIHLTAAKNIRIADCGIVNANGNAIGLVQCNGAVTGNSISGSADNAIYSLDGTLKIRANTIAHSGNGGIRVWQSAKRSDGSIVEDNTIEDTQARAGGDGQNGNAINVYRAADVTVRNNVIRRAAFTAVRGNAASRIKVIGNQCFALGEVAIYSEFEFEDALIADNLIDVAALGIAVTNMDKGGHGAVVRNNTIRNVVNKRPQGGPDSYGVGIGVEADTEVTGNKIDNAPVMGIEVGSGPYLRNVIVSRNDVRRTGIGIGVTVVEGAGKATIEDNVIAQAARGAIVGMRWDKAATGDLAREGADKFPNLRVSGNTVN